MESCVQAESGDAPAAVAGEGYDVSWESVIGALGLIVRRAFEEFGRSREPLETRTVTTRTRQTRHGVEVTETTTVKRAERVGDVRILRILLQCLDRQMRLLKMRQGDPKKFVNDVGPLSEDEPEELDAFEDGEDCGDELVAEVKVGTTEAVDADDHAEAAASRVERENHRESGAGGADLSGASANMLTENRLAENRLAGCEPLTGSTEGNNDPRTGQGGSLQKGVPQNPAPGACGTVTLPAGGLLLQGVASGPKLNEDDVRQQLESWLREADAVMAQRGLTSAAVLAAAS